MKTFNINEYIYIQITQAGWEYLKGTIGQRFINACIDTEHYRREVDGEVWYRLQAHQVFELLPIKYNILYGTTIMIEDEFLKTKKL